jgi:hypothetical protein
MQLLLVRASLRSLPAMLLHLCGLVGRGGPAHPAALESALHRWAPTSCQDGEAKLVTCKVACVCACQTACLSDCVAGIEVAGCWRCLCALLPTRRTNYESAVMAAKKSYLSKVMCAPLSAGIATGWRLEAPRLAKTAAGRQPRSGLVGARIDQLGILCHQLAQVRLRRSHIAPAARCHRHHQA